MSTKYCPQCGSELAQNVQFCPNCGAKVGAANNPQIETSTPNIQQEQGFTTPPPNVQQQNYPIQQTPSAYQQQYPVNTPVKTKSKVTAGILAILLGGIGIHKFYLGKIGAGILYLLFCWTGIPAFIGLIEGIIYLVTDDEEFQRKYVNHY